MKLVVFTLIVGLLASARASHALQGDESDAVARLVARLGDKDPAVRRQAVLELGRLGSKAGEAAPELVRVLEDEAIEVREAAAFALGRLGETALPGLVGALTGKEVVRDGALAALWRMGRAAVPDLKKVLEGSDPTLRAAAVRALRWMRLDVPDDVAIFRKHLRDEDYRVRREAAAALRFLAEDEESVTALQALARDRAEHPAVRAEALLSLPDVALEHATVHSFAAQIAFRDDEIAEVRAAAAEALGRMRVGADETVPMLIDLLGRKDGPAILRAKAARALHWLGRGGAALVKALKDVVPAVRAAAAEALGAAGRESPETTARSLLSLLNDKDETVRASVLRGLGDLGALDSTRARLKPGMVVAAFQKGLGDHAARVRRAAAGALSQYGSEGRDAVRALTRMVKGDEDREVRRASAEALGAIGAPARAAVPMLLDAVEDASDPGLRAAALTGVAAILGQGAPPPQLKAALEDLDPDVRIAAAAAVIGLDRETWETLATHVLIETLRHEDGGVRDRAARTIQRLGLRRAEVSAALAGLLEDEYRVVRGTAAWALGWLGEVEGPRDVVVRRLREPYWTVRYGAAFALDRLGVEEDDEIEALARAAGDGHPWVSATAESALRRIGGRRVLAALEKVAGSDPDPKVRLRVRGFLERMGDW